MILSIWRPKTKLINKKQIVVCYSKSSLKEIYESGSSNLRIVYKCDGDNCKNPNKIYSISRCHLTSKRSKTVNEAVQICRSCQTMGDKNPRYGDNRTWVDIMGKSSADKMKKIYRDKFKGDLNPSKMDSVKSKKGQIIINYDNTKKYVDSFGLSLISIDGVDKFAKLNIKCNKGHTFDIKWTVFKSKKDNINICRFCFYESVRIPFEKIEEFNTYSKKVRLLTLSNFNKNIELVDGGKFKKVDSSNYHIDHIYSVSDGFINKIDPDIISSYINLRVIKKVDNLIKGRRSDMTLDELIEKYRSIF